MTPQVNTIIIWQYIHTCRKTSGKTKIVVRLMGKIENNGWLLKVFNNLRVTATTLDVYKTPLYAAYNMERQVSMYRLLYVYCQYARPVMCLSGEFIYVQYTFISFFSCILQFCFFFNQLSQQPRVSQQQPTHTLNQCSTFYFRCNCANYPALLLYFFLFFLAKKRKAIIGMWRSIYAYQITIV